MENIGTILAIVSLVTTFISQIYSNIRGQRIKALEESISDLKDQNNFLRGEIDMLMKLQVEKTTIIEDLKSTISNYQLSLDRCKEENKNLLINLKVSKDEK